ncbi:MAG: Cell division integral membrane protein, YggT and half-length relatives, partial [uncultured Chloroflexia bacterium]
DGLFVDLLPVIVSDLIYRDLCAHHHVLDRPGRPDAYHTDSARDHRADPRADPPHHAEHGHVRPVADGRHYSAPGAAAPPVERHSL